MRILQPKLGILNQGAIFTCARADRYGGKRVYGLAITARCDVAQDKYPVLNYIPMVTLDDWLCVDGFEILRARAQADTEGRLRQAMGQANIALSILNSLSPRGVHEEFFAGKTGKGAKPAEAFLEVVQAHEKLAALAEATPTAVRDLYKSFPKLRAAMLKDLVLQRLAGYYFLPRAFEDGAPSGWVLLLREPSYLPRALSKFVAQGADRDDRAIGAADPQQRYLCFAQESFAMPVGQIASPEIEHILQGFASLFGRIGIPDLEQSYIDEISSREPTPPEAKS